MGGSTYDQHVTSATCFLGVLYDDTLDLCGRCCLFGAICETYERGAEICSEAAKTFQVSLLPRPCRRPRSEHMRIKIFSSNELVANFANDTAVILPLSRPVFGGQGFLQNTVRMREISPQPLRNKMLCRLPRQKMLPAIESMLLPEILPSKGLFWKAWLRVLLALSDWQRHMAGPGFGLISGCLSHGGLHGAAKIVAEGSPKTSPPFLRAWHAGHPWFLGSPTTSAFRHAGGESGWRALTVCAGPLPWSRLGCAVSKIV